MHRQFERRIATLVERVVAVHDPEQGGILLEQGAQLGVGLPAKRAFVVAELGDGEGRVDGADVMPTPRLDAMRQGRGGRPHRQLGAFLSVGGIEQGQTGGHGCERDQRHGPTTWPRAQGTPGLDQRGADARAPRCQQRAEQDK